VVSPERRKPRRRTRRTDQSTDSCTASADSLLRGGDEWTSDGPAPAPAAAGAGGSAVLGMSGRTRIGA
jgi:hypothetical protein